MPKTTQSNEYIAQLAAAEKFSARINDARNLSGPVQYASIIVPFDATAMANNDVVSLLKLPPGALVMPELSQIIVTDDLTSGALTVNIGDILVPARYGIAVDIANPGVKQFSASGATVFPAALTLVSGVRYKTDDTGVPATDTSLITMTMGGVTTEAGALTVLLAYKCL